LSSIQDGTLFFKERKIEMGRIKLFYTVDEEHVLEEAAKIINLGADDLQQAVSLFNQVQATLRGRTVEGDDGDGAPVNVALAVEMIEEFREALLNVDTRLEEVTAIIEGYEEYRRMSKKPAVSPQSPLPKLMTATTPPKKED
jgi:hypothetical protein